MAKIFVIIKYTFSRKSGKISCEKGRFNPLSQEQNDLLIPLKRDILRILTEDNKYHEKEIANQIINKLIVKMIRFAINILPRFVQTINWSNTRGIDPRESWNASYGLAFLVRLGILPKTLDPWFPENKQL